ncbi:MAG: cytochrome c [Pseudomonadota bacterium]
MYTFSPNTRQFLLATTTLLAFFSLKAEADTPGRALSEGDVVAWDISIPPSGAGLPEGSGSVTEGIEIYANQCAACHGATGTEGHADRLVGGIGTLDSDAPVKTLGSFWPHATKIFDCIRRAMPFYAPGSLTDAEVYAVTAYLLHLNGVLPKDERLDAPSLRALRLPNAGGFIAAYPSDN